MLDDLARDNDVESPLEMSCKLAVQVQSKGFNMLRCGIGRVAKDHGIAGDRVKLRETGVLQPRPHPAAPGTEIQNGRSGRDVVEEEPERSFLTTGRAVQAMAFVIPGIPEPPSPHHTLSELAEKRICCRSECMCFSACRCDVSWLHHEPGNLWKRLTPAKPQPRRLK